MSVPSGRKFPPAEANERMEPGLVHGGGPGSVMTGSAQAVYSTALRRRVAIRVARDLTGKSRTASPAKRNTEHVCDGVKPS